MSDRQRWHYVADWNRDRAAFHDRQLVKVKGYDKRMEHKRQKARFLANADCLQHLIREERKQERRLK